jgi:hypothetical protein
LTPTREAAAPAGGTILSGSSARRSMDVPPAAETGEIARLEAESAEKDVEVAELRRQVEVQQLRSKELRGMADKLAARSDSDDQLRALSVQRDSLSAQLQQASQAVENMLPELARLSAERDDATSRAKSLEGRVSELLSLNQEQERLLKDTDQYLSADRDIRELMGARNLYIADVFDVDSHSLTRKPFGRVFYTREKSLVLYAYDLDRQPRVRGASAFQVWGQEEASQHGRPKSLNLGILYMDSESNRRWILRFDDPQKLARLDSIFVTEEPSGGSPKPTGKPFLYAMLRRQANHP